MLAHLFEMPIVGVSPPVSRAAGHPVGGMGGYAGLARLRFPGQSSRLAVGPGGGSGYGADRALGGTWAASAPPVALGQAVLDELGHLTSAGPYTATEGWEPVQHIVPTRQHDHGQGEPHDSAVAGHARGASGSRGECGSAGVRHMVDISVDVHRMFDTMDGFDFLTFTPRGGAGIVLPLVQHLSILAPRDRDDRVPRSDAGGH